MSVDESGSRRGVLAESTSLTVAGAVAFLLVGLALGGVFVAVGWRQSPDLQGLVTKRFQLGFLLVAAVCVIRVDDGSRFVRFRRLSRSDLAWVAFVLVTFKASGFVVDLLTRLVRGAPVESTGHASVPDPVF